MAEDLEHERSAASRALLLRPDSLECVRLSDAVATTLCHGIPTLRSCSTSVKRCCSLCSCSRFEELLAEPQSATEARCVFET